MSTTTLSNVALSFQSGAFVRPYFERVFFEIQIENEIDKQWKIPFAAINNVSYNQDEDEVLFSMGSMFRIVDVDTWIDDLWLVQLTLLEHSCIDESLREFFFKEKYW
ncbi:unnamed protein product [Rotaria sp. Silwood2]|nr:unnamed protein product [Rotaria sp. Silwood2]CAF3188309.1 unnamed protein product [Rotaria sp. Silwood2]CAF3376336.1 unnamed protein product [Rotaria sp. Silwood2]CAF3478770.1 unnamed protein product [Rotaria sp. Silwood2]CAF4551817.1 unnamed protein product [Rotaria sp. Silwood2]